ncbi:pyocin knob domain-containing protein [Leuconostoc citreum]|uniref:pyocin knob domain-containing protein n=1 Tax=Leuconostoc citreum TaxID=33964 RepID=UPI001C1FE7E4|nr:pyocin knob domain-containing protein [Leuconostoc citreum]MBU7450649.1 hypothetical protein [Leuconostoc citreum]
MADSYSKWVMTNAFASNSQSALNTGNKIEWVALKTSDDTHTLNDLPGFNDTTLATAKIKQTSSINSVVLNGNTVTITGLFNSAGNTSDYYIKTIFLVAKYNGSEFLAGATVANTSGSAFRMPAASTTEITEFTARPQISVTNSSTISTTVDPVAAATNERVNSLETSLNSKIEDINTDKQKLWNKFADYVTKATAETITGVKTFTQTIVGSITGNAGTATKLQTPRRINGTNFDGTDDINVLASNDSDIVHRSRDETVAGNKTFSDTVTFNKKINGVTQINLYPIKTLQGLATKMNMYAGEWVGGSDMITDMPETGYANISVKPYGGVETAGTIVLTYTDSNKMFVSHAATPLTWLKVANDATVVHNTGDETVAGNKKFSGNIATTSDNSMINGGGNDQALAMVKKSGYAPFIGIGSNNQFKVKQSDQEIVIPNANFTDIFSVDTSGNVKAGVSQDLVPLDKNVAHPSKDEKVTGNWSFDNEILGTVTASKRPVMFDLADGTDLNSIRIGGSYSCGSNRVGNSPVNNWFSLVVVQNGQYNGAQTLTDTNSGNVYTRVWNTSGNWFSAWEKLSSDSKVVHNNGNETIYDKKTFDAVTTFNNGIVNKPISMNGFKIDVSQLVSGTYNVWQGDISGCPSDYGIVEVFENVSNTMYRFTQTNLPEIHAWVQVKNSGGFTGWKQQM